MAAYPRSGNGGVPFPHPLLFVRSSPSWAAVAHPRSQAPRRRRSPHESLRLGLLSSRSSRPIISLSASQRGRVATSGSPRNEDRTYHPDWSHQ